MGRFLAALKSKKGVLTAPGAMLRMRRKGGDAFVLGKPGGLRDSTCPPLGRCCQETFIGPALPVASSVPALSRAVESPKRYQIDSYQAFNYMDYRPIWLEFAHWEAAQA